MARKLVRNRLTNMNRRWFLGMSMSAAGSALTLSAPALARAGELRIGLTAVVVREYARVYNDFRSYLSVRTGRAVSFVQRRSYADIMDLLRRQQRRLGLDGFQVVEPSLYDAIRESWDRMTASTGDKEAGSP